MTNDLRRNAPRTHPRRGLSLGDALVAIVIVLTGLVLLVPGLVVATATERRTECQNNLRQIGVAMHEYASVKKTFPPALAYGHSLHTHLLPYLGRDDLAKQFQLDEFLDVGMETPIALFRCPDDRMGLGNAVTNYRGCGASENWDSLIGNGVFGSSLGRKPSDIPNGLAHTMAMSETLVGTDVDLTGAGPEGRQRNRVYVVATRRFTLPDRQEAFESYCQDRLDDGGRVMPNGIRWYLGTWGMTVYNHAATPNRISCRRANDGGQYTASSLHTDGVNGLLCDNSVRIFHDGVDLSVWRKLANAKPLSE